MMKLSQLRNETARPRDYPKVDEVGLFNLLKKEHFEPMEWKEQVLYLCTYLDYLENFSNHSADELFAIYKTDEICREAKLLTGMRFEVALQPLIANANEGTDGAVRLHKLYFETKLLPAHYFLTKAIDASPNPYDNASIGMKERYAFELSSELTHFECRPEEMLKWVGAPTFELTLLRWWEETTKQERDLTALSTQFIALEEVWKKTYKDREKEFLDTIQILLLEAIRISTHNLLREREGDDFDVIESPLLATIAISEVEKYWIEMTGC